jgi:prolyl oligopeptidase
MIPARFAALAIGLLCLAMPFKVAAQTTDANLWLEAVDSSDALDWVRAENTRSEPVLTRDPRFSTLQSQALAVLSAQDRIPTPAFIGEAVYNFWQDAEHVRGIWRRTSLQSFRSPSPVWETVLDLDALASQEKANWIWKGALCRPATHDRCLIQLSNGGKDAVQVREFDLASKAFVEGGFHLPEGKQSLAWLDQDTLLLTRDWGPGSLTESGYGRIIRSLARGQTLEQAKTLFEAQTRDVSATPSVLRDAKGGRVVLAGRGLDFFNTAWFMMGAGGEFSPLALPTRSSIHGLFEGRIILSIQQDWSMGGQMHAAGSLLAVDPTDLSRIEVLYRPSARQALDRDQIRVTDNRVVAVLYENVRGSVVSFRPGADGWVQSRYPGLANAAVTLVSTADTGDAVLYSEETFIAPTRLMLGMTPAAESDLVKALPARFAAEGLMVEQKEANSRDGTKIPYFLVRRKNLRLDGQAPTLLHAYGGFQLSKLPVYDPVVGKLWLERGGAYVVANIRGGGEFGPAWHTAALKANRQRAFDDYYAVAEALIADRVTSPRHLGAYGRSNGGLLMGVAMTQRPDLWNAVVVESPLLDMLRYHRLPAGASWIGEYGDPEIAGEAAWIASYSPYQALKAGVKYPRAYITTSTKDDRVHPGHARKFAARLGQVGAPYLYYENLDGGHANGADPRANARRWAMHYVYLTQQLMD